MEVYNYTIDKSLNIFKYFNTKNICFLDIETTGLSRKYNQIYLIGIVYYDENNSTWELVQFFANNLEQEKEILEKFNGIISSFALIINYNGNTFDLPFIESRMKQYDIKSNMKNTDSFDIYREIRKNQQYLKLENLKLKTVEESLGIYRNDEYSGKECIEFYYQYIKTGDKILKDNILSHNYDDLYYLIDILNIFDHLRNIKTLSINVGEDILYIEILDILVEKNILSINCNTSPQMEIDIIHYDENFNLKWENGDSLIVDLNIKEGLITPTKRCLFINKGDIPIDSNLRDLSPFMVPNPLMLLKVEKELIMENIKNIVRELVLYVL